MLLLICSIAAAQQQEPPAIPVGLDAYGQWQNWPMQRIGVRAYMRSTYDRTGGNEGADASHFLYRTAPDRNVTLDVQGAGILYFARYNHWHGSPWHYEVDNADHVISETSSADPNDPNPQSIFEPHSALPSPLTWTWSATKGADLMWVPIEFQNSFQMAYERTHYGTGYYIYHLIAPGTKLSHPIHSWDGKTPPDSDVLNLVNRSGSDLSDREGVSDQTGVVDIPPDGAVTLANLRGKGIVTGIQLIVAKDRAIDFSRVHLRLTWDRRALPSVDAPVALFCGAGTLYNRDGREWLVKAFPVSIRDDGQRVYLSSYWPMPYFKGAKIELVGADRWIQRVQWKIRTAPVAAPENTLAYFHATYRDHPNPQPGRDLELLNTRGEENQEDWSGSFIGTSFIFSHNAFLGTLEGDPRFYFDDSQTPQAQGTGTEEWGGGGDYWGGRNMTLPFAGHPVGAPSPREAKCNDDKIESAYRFLLTDLMPFGKNARITLEHGGTNESKEHYETITYWYGYPAASLVKSDQLKIGDEPSEKSHDYHSPDATKPFSITSRYEWGVDHLGDKEIFPAQTQTGRITKGTSEFILSLKPDNHGVLIRRTLDYSYPNQRAEVFVSDVGTDNWKPAGIWYLAGSNTCLYSNPKEELGPAQTNIETSNRRFRDDEFLISRDLIRGKSKIAVRIKFAPVPIPLIPGAPLPDQAWSEIRYDCYCWVLPTVFKSR